MTAALDGRRRALRGYARRGSWNLVDQVLSAVTNVVVAFLVARAVDADAFGAFAVAFLVFTLAIGVARALAGQPLSIRFAAASPNELVEAAGAGMGAVVGFAAVLGAASALAGVLARGVLGSTLLAMSVALPALLLQDTCRMTFFAQRRPQLAALNDAVWALVQFPVMVVLVVLDVSSPWAFVLAWGGGALSASAVGLVQIGTWPLLTRGRSWLVRERDLVLYLVAEYLLNAGVYQGGVLAVGALVGVGDVGSIRAAQVLLGPLGILTSACWTFLLPELSSRRRSASSSAQIALGISAAIAGLSVAYVVVLLLLPGSLGLHLLGDTWTGARSVLLPMAIGSVALGATTGPQLTVFARGRAKVLLFVQVVQAPILLVCMGLGIAAADAVGAAWGIATNSLLMVPICFAVLRYVLRRDIEPPDEPVIPSNVVDMVGLAEIGPDRTP
jgi:O-antigen/teichoic acid export membrane protein